MTGIQGSFAFKTGQPLRFKAHSQSSVGTQPTKEPHENDVFTKATSETNSAPPPNFHLPTEANLLRLQLSNAVQKVLSSLHGPKVTAAQKSQLLTDMAKSQNPIKTALMSEVFQVDAHREELKKQFKISIYRPVSTDNGKGSISLNHREALARLHQADPATFEALLGKKDYALFKERLEEKEPEKAGVPPHTFDEIIAKFYGPTDSTSTQ